MSFVLDKLLPNWVSVSFPIIEKICLVVIAILALCVVVLVFMQITGEGNGNNALTGESNKDSYYSQNKSGSREGRITKLIYIFMGVIVILSIIFFILIKISGD